MVLERLNAIMPPPSRPREVPTPLQIADCEEEHGALPSDYKAFIQQYGTGCVDEFIWILNPASANRNLCLGIRIGELLAALRDAAPAVLGFPFSLEEGAEELLPVAVSDNGDLLAWWKAGKPESWPVVVLDSRLGEHAVYALCLVEFLSQVLEGNLRVSIFPGDFPSETPEFAAMA